MSSFAGENLKKLRQALKEIGVDGILVSMKSSFDNYDSGVSDINLISGFSGSNGRAVVTRKKAILAVDGRYSLQARKQTDPAFWQIELFPKVDTVGMVKEFCPSGSSLALASSAHSYNSYLALKNKLEAEGYKVVSLDKHPVVDLRPSLSKSNEIVSTETRYIPERIQKMTKKLKEDEVLLVANKEAISWVFGTRKTVLGTDKSPVAQVLALFPKSGKPLMFSDLPIKSNDFFTSYPLEQFLKEMKRFKNKTVMASFSSVPAFFILRLLEQGFKVLPTKGNYASLEHLKTPDEIKAQKKAAFETSRAFIKALAYIDYHIRQGEAITEKEAIDFFKSDQAIDFAFNPICASGENTAVVHYSPTSGNNSPVSLNHLFLFDAGFHFSDSSTDMTRTIFIGDNPADEFKTMYSLVLKSFITYSLSKFPDKTYACSLDSICRYHFWRQGLDYDFGTGHGVGNFRSVHEAPHISRFSADQITANMITTVEPGFYTETYGIRLENMLLSAFEDNSQMVCFKTLTFVPFCRSLIVKELLDNDCLGWLNEYHSKTREFFEPFFENDPIILNWLKDNTEAIV